VSKSKGAIRRTKVERGLYQRGKTYFAMATPPGARQPKWKALGEVNLSEARRLRDEFVADVKGGKVARARAKVSEVATLWLAEMGRLRDLGQLRPRVYAGYESAVEKHINPHLGHRYIGTLTAEDLVGWHRWQQSLPGKGDKRLSAWTIRSHWVPLRGVLGYAARHGYAATNPADLLTRRERPKNGSHRLRYLDADEIKAVLKQVPQRYDLAVEIAIFCGLRISELLAIRWREVSFADGVLRVTGQIDEQGKRVPYAKSDAGCRDVVLPTFLSRRLKHAKVAAEFSGDGDFVLGSDVGTPMHVRNLRRRGLEKACKDAGLDDVTFHTLRHTFASILIGQGNDPVYVAGQMGHKDPAVTLKTYAKLFDRARHADAHREAMDRDFGAMFGSGS
jgi:integrase